MKVIQEFQARYKPMDSVFLLEDNKRLYCSGWNGEWWLNCWWLDEYNDALQPNEKDFIAIPTYRATTDNPLTAEYVIDEIEILK